MTKEKKIKKTNVLAQKAKKKSYKSKLEYDLSIFNRHKIHKIQNENKLIILIKTLSQLSDNLFDTQIYLQKCKLSLRRNKIKILCIDYNIDKYIKIYKISNNNAINNKIKKLTNERSETFNNYMNCRNNIDKLLNKIYLCSENIKNVGKKIYEKKQQLLEIHGPYLDTLCMINKYKQLLGINNTSEISHNIPLETELQFFSKNGGKEYSLKDYINLEGDNIPYDNSDEQYSLNNNPDNYLEEQYFLKDEEKYNHKYTILRCSPRVLLDYINNII